MNPNNLSPKEIKELRKVTRKAVNKAVEDAAEAMAKKMETNGEEIITAIKQTWTWPQRFQLSVWLLFGRGPW